MTKTDFINGLQEGLRGQVSAQTLQESVEYYSRYIEEQKQAGKSEEQVLEELGPVQWIVKSIIDAHGGEAGGEERAQTQQQTQQTRQGGSKQSVLFTLNTWYGKLALILAIVLIAVMLVGLIVIIVMAAWYLLPVIAVGALILILLRIFLNIGRQG